MTTRNTPLDKAIQSTVERFNQMVTDTTPERGQQAQGYLSLSDCFASGKHLSDCDDDGYCNRCGEQDAAPNQPQQHTATPWRVEPKQVLGMKDKITNLVGIWSDAQTSESGRSEWVANTWQADAAFIVRAVNSFDKLVRTLRLVECLNSIRD